MAARKKAPAKRAPAGKKRGAKPKMVPTPKMLANIRAWAADGMSHEDILTLLGVSRSTFYTVKRNEESVRKALAEGRAEGLQRATNALARKGFEDMDTGALIFYLINRDPENWKQRKDVNKRVEEVGSIEDYVREKVAQQRAEGDGDSTVH